MAICDCVLNNKHIESEGSQFKLLFIFPHLYDIIQINKSQHLF